MCRSRLAAKHNQRSGCIFERKAEGHVSGVGKLEQRLEGGRSLPVQQSVERNPIRAEPKSSFTLSNLPRLHFCRHGTQYLVPKLIRGASRIRDRILRHLLASSAAAT
jgi:hypothetical protein